MGTPAKAAEITRLVVCGTELLIDDFGKEYAAYVCHVITNTPTTENRHILRRYSDWERLRNSLPDSGFSLPKFPPKLMFGNVKPRVLEDRRHILQVWIAEVLRAPNLRRSDVIRRWVLPTQDDLDYEREYANSQLDHRADQLLRPNDTLNYRPLEPAVVGNPQPEPQPMPTDLSQQPQSQPGISPPPNLHMDAAPSLTVAPAKAARRSEETLSSDCECGEAASKEKSNSERSHLKSVGQTAVFMTRMRTESALTDDDARVLPAHDGRYEYVVAFVPGDDALSIAKDARSLLNEHDLCVVCVPGNASQGSQHSLLVTTSAAHFDREAERDAAYKWTKQNDSLTGKPRKRLFTKSHCSEFAGQYHKGKLRYDYGSPDFFSAAERARMVRSIMDDVRAKDDTCSALLARVGKLKDYAHINSPQLEHESLVDALLRTGTIENRLLYGAQPDLSEPAVDVGKTQSDSVAVQLWKETKVVWPLAAPVDAVQSYYGEQVAIYFAWLDCLTMMLIGPSLFGLYVWLARGDEASIDTDIRTTLYSFFMVIWGFAFLQTWKRTANDCAWRWDTFEADRVSEPNPRFHGFQRLSPVTGQPDLHYKSHQRWMTIGLVSLPVTLAMLSIAFVVMSMSLNLQGYVEQDSPIYVRVLAHHGDPGGVFDKNDPVAALLPVCISSAAIAALSATYRSIATWLTHLENHKFLHEYEASLIYKRFMFDMFVYWIQLFYTAFWELDIIKLRSQLVSIYTIDTARRAATEAILPYILARRAQILEWAKAASAKKSDGDSAPEQQQQQQQQQHEDKKEEAETRRTDEDQNQNKVEDSDGASQTDQNAPIDSYGGIVAHECALDAYEQFDDYLEMVIQLGYIQLFAAAFPLAAPLSLIANVVEIRTDAFKLAFNMRRPHATRCRDTGPWENITAIIIWMSCATNVLVAGLSSRQLRELMPAYFEVGACSPTADDNPVGGAATTWSVTLMVILEHLLLLIGILSMTTTRPLPAHVRDDVARREWEKSQALLEQRLQVRKDERLALRRRQKDERRARKSEDQDQTLRK